MKKFMVIFVLLAACGTDDSGSQNNATNNVTTGSNNGSNNQTVVQNNQTTNTNNQTTTTNNQTNNMTNVSDMGTSDSGMDMGMADVGEDAAPDMMMDMAPAPEGDTCADAIPIAIGQTLSGSTVGASDSYSARAVNDNCPNNPASGRDRAYVFRPTADGSVRVMVTPEATYDPAIYIRLDCDAAACLDGTVLNGAGTPESVTFQVTANTDYFIIVDGELGDNGTYNITLEAP
ncbi:MAG: hypothetical protein R3E66_21435 [bacterium]